MPLRAPDYINGNAPVANGHDGESIRPICAFLAARVKAFLSQEAATPLLKTVQEQTKIALGVIDEALQKYSLEELSLSYNGGKDCLVLLILLLCSLAKKDHLPKSLHSVYIVSKHPFAEMNDFVDESAETYKLDLLRYNMPMAEAFRTYLAEHKKVKAILVGTRRTDPHGQNLTHFNETDSGWPAFMRVHPVIDWHYAEIWEFIRHFDIPYCPLYDQGFTSLGGTRDTHPNPALQKENGEFRPAYELVEDEAERLGRDW